MYMKAKVEINYKKIKRMYMRVKDNTIIISAPFFTSKDTINSFINNNQDFINKQLNKQMIKENKSLKAYDYITILNHKYQIIPSNSIVKYTDNFVFLNEEIDFKRQIKKMFANEFLKKMTLLTKDTFNEMNLKCSFPKITVKDVKTRWGSYNKKKHEVSYALELLFKDDFCIKYVVVHELAHTLQFNHSPEFYRIVSTYFKDYKLAKAKLKEN